MAGYQWTKTKPSAAGWYWFRGPAHEADPFIVQVDEVGQFQWPDGGFQGWEGRGQVPFLLAEPPR